MITFPLRQLSIPILIESASDPQEPSLFWTAMLLLGLMLISMYLIMRIRSRRQRVAHQPGPYAQIERLKQARGMRGDLEDLMVEIEQLAKRFSAQLDAKSLQLEKLIDEADQKIAQMQNACQTSAPPQAPTLGAEPDDPLAHSIYTLADQGVGPADIARRLDEHVGKVELILALRSA